MPNDLKNKKVLMFGLGQLGGGVATTNWLLQEGATVTVTDLKDAKHLAPSVKRVEDHLKKIARDGKAYDKLRARLTWALGGHSNALVDAATVVVVNPDVSVRNPFIQRALAAGRRVVNEGTLFYDHWKKKTVGVTGTRGKTTTSNWAHHFIKGSILAGNSMTKPFMSMVGESRATAAVTELPSFILELFPLSRVAPDVAVITNLYRDHLNRHGTMEEYAKAKAAIFLHQKRGDTLVLNSDDPWTTWFLEQEPKAHVHFFSLSHLPVEREGVWHDHDRIWERGKGKERMVLDVTGFAAQWGQHNLANCMAAALAAHATGVAWATIQERIATLPVVPYRQEVVYKSSTLTVVNDTTATSPEGGIAALQRWGGPNCILITGGTDRELDYRMWAKELLQHITKNNLVFLAGSATQKMRKALGQAVRGVRTYETLEDAWGAALKRSGLFINPVVLFSPAAKSFELFQNEFDRGQQFNALVLRSLKAK